MGVEVQDVQSPVFLSIGPDNRIDDGAVTAQGEDLDVATEQAGDDSLDPPERGGSFW